MSSNGGASFTGGAAGADPRTQATVNVPAQAGRTSAGSGPRSTGRASSASPTTTASTADDETTGYSDFSISGSSDLSSFRAKRVTARRCLRRPSSRVSSSATTRGSTRSTTPIRSGRTRATRPVPLPGHRRPGTRPMCAPVRERRPAGGPDGQRRGHLHRRRRHSDALGRRLGRPVTGRPGTVHHPTAPANAPGLT